MIDLLKNIFALVVFFCIAAVLVIIGVHILLLLLAVVAVAFVWYSIKFYLLRRKIRQTLQEHENIHFSDALRQAQQQRGAQGFESGGTVIEGEFEDITEESTTTRNKHDPL